MVKPRRSGAIIGIWLATVIAGTACAREPDAYGPLRQRTTQPIPGTLSFVLEPASDFHPSFDPDAVYANLVELAPGRVTITWATDVPGDSQVQYGTTTAYGSTTALDRNLVISHSVTITGLARKKQYFFQVLSKDATGNPSSATGNFRTK